MRSRSILLARLVVALAVGAGPAASAADTAMAATTTSAMTSAATTATETRTITQPASTDTVTETRPASVPGTTSVTNRTATVQLTPATAATQDQSGSGGLPGWAWVLIALGAVLIGIVMFLLGRRGGRPPSGPASRAGGHAATAGTRRGRTRVNRLLDLGCEAVSFSELHILVLERAPALALAGSAVTESQDRLSAVAGAQGVGRRAHHGVSDRADDRVRSRRVNGDRGDAPGSQVGCGWISSALYERVGGASAARTTRLTGRGPLEEIPRYPVLEPAADAFYTSNAPS